MKFIALKLCLVLLLLPLTLSQTACPGDGGKEPPPPTREDVLRYSRLTADGLKDVVRILHTNNIQSKGFDKAVDLADKGVAAFEQHRDADGLALTAALIDVFENEVVADVDLIKNQTTRTVVMVAVAVARVALTQLSAAIDKVITVAEVYRISIPGVTAFQSSDAQTKAEAAKAKIKAFKKKKQWRCKNAVTGRFEKMDFCKAHPETSVVITFNR